MRRLAAMVLCAGAAWAAPRSVDKGALPALSPVQGTLGKHEQHRYRFRNPMGRFTVRIAADFAADVTIKGKRASGTEIQLTLDDTGDVDVVIGAGRDAKGGGYVVQIDGEWSCGGIAGLMCPLGTRCDIRARHPDAMGPCVAEKKK